MYPHPNSFQRAGAFGYVAQEGADGADNTQDPPPPMHNVRNVRQTRMVRTEIWVRETRNATFTSRRVSHSTSESLLASASTPSAAFRPLNPMARPYPRPRVRNYSAARGMQMGDGELQFAPHTQHAPPFEFQERGQWSESSQFAGPPSYHYAQGDGMQPSQGGGHAPPYYYYSNTDNAAANMRRATISGPPPRGYCPPAGGRTHERRASFQQSEIRSTQGVGSPVTEEQYAYAEPEPEQEEGGLEEDAQQPEGVAGEDEAPYAHGQEHDRGTSSRWGASHAHPQESVQTLQEMMRIALAH